MLAFAMRLDELNKTLQDFPQLDIYNRYYGLSSKDLGLYALHEHTIAGAVWIRLLRVEDGANGFIDAQGNISINAESADTLKGIILPAGDIDNNNVIDQLDILPLACAGRLVKYGV